MSFRSKTSKLLGTALNVFSEDNLIEYLPAAGGTFNFKGIYDESWEELDPETHTMISDTRPNLGIRLSDFPAPPVKSDRLVYEGATYTVEDIREDGQGGATLFLYKV